ncbi:hypothetical protein ABZX30_29850 [Streptomyces sp. NPDC004542]|uniref:hypothetical protein n=1 Tax=Streptomyces sp. NPDC004542 TaxID=3154281 RepID=UPI0033A77500
MSYRDYDFVETKSIPGCTPLTVAINADFHGSDDNGIRTKLIFSPGDGDLEVKRSDGEVGITLRGVIERGQLVTALRWMADRLDTI